MAISEEVALFNKVLKVAVDGAASDIHVKVGGPIIFRIHGDLIAVDGVPMPTEEWLNAVVDGIVPSHVKRHLEETREADFSYYVPGIGRFRTNIFQQRGQFCIAMRYVKTQVPNFEDLGLLDVIREIARALGVSKANMEEGSMRADVNVSVRPVGSKTFGTRTETKNMVSFKFIKTAIEYEAKRQVEILENGGTVSQDTMRFNQGDGTTSVQRSKEDALDYRYFPDPDLLELEITDEEIERIRKNMPELPTATRARYINEFGLSEYDATRLTETVDISHWYDAAVNSKKERAKPVANWLISELFAHPENMDIENKITENADPDAPRIITPVNIAELVDMIASNEINGKQAKEIFIKMLDGERGTIHEIADKYGMKQITDTSAIESAVDEVIKNNPAQVEQYKSGKVGLLGFFVGNVMKATHGQANPAMVSDLLKQKLG